jgi:AAA ATPase domain/Effector-associated domain 1
VIDSDGAQALLKEAERGEELAHSGMVERLAILATFDPRRLDGPDAHDVVHLLCESLPSQEAILRERQRIDALVGMLQRGGHAELARVRRSVEPHTNSPLQRMLDAFVLGDRPALDDRDEDELLASLTVWQWVTEAVAHAGQTLEAPIEPGKDAIESRLALLDVTRAIRRLARSGCVGREAELARLHAYRRSRPTSSDFQAEPAMVVHGIGGVGKSTLVARFAMDLYEERDNPDAGVWAYLDLDRPTLASCDAAAIMADINRQVAAQRPDERRKLVRSEEVMRRRNKGAGLEAFDSAWTYRDTASEFIAEMRGIADGALVVVLDTYEQLERNKPDRAAELWDLFARMAAELPRFRLIVSGRAPAKAFVEASRPDRQLHVVGLQDGAALELLRHFVRLEAEKANRPVVEIDDDAGRDVIALVGGIPLTVRLAARVLIEEGPDAIADAANRARTLHRVRSEFVSGFLYQRVLNHVTARPAATTIEPPVTTNDLRRLARASIALRHITVELVERVLVPSLLPIPTATPAKMFDELASEVAFIESEGSALRLREELRAPALAAVRLDDPEVVRRVHLRAAEFYAESPDDTAAELELAYHRLALGAPLSEFDEATLRQLEPAADDLPPSSAAQVRDAVGGRAALATEQDLERWERKMLPIVDSALRADRLDEARRLLAERTERSIGTELYRLESRLAQADGDVDAAAAAAGRDLEAAGFAADPTRFAAAAVRLAGLHELRGAAGAADEALREASESPLLAGYPALRLEMQLDRINTRERTGIEDEHSQWLNGLEARALMQRIDPSELDGNTALVRLLAAAFGREEPDRIREAVRRVGVGHREDPVRVQTLTSALAAWDSSLPEPGSLAKRATLRLEGDDPDAILHAWRALAGLGTDAGIVLDRLWRQVTPPESVREALRAIYLWWAVETDPTAMSQAHEMLPDFLTESPINWERKEIRTLEELMLTAYPTNTDTVMLASKTGLDPALISRASSGRRFTREILATASRGGRLGDLVETVLSDPLAVSIHEPLRALVGDAWLAAHHL